MSVLRSQITGALHLKIRTVLQLQMMAEGQGVSSLPLPPMQYINLYTDENVKRGRIPEPPPPVKVCKLFQWQMKQSVSLGYGCLTWKMFLHIICRVHYIAGYLLHVWQAIQC